MQGYFKSFGKKWKIFTKKCQISLHFLFWNVFSQPRTGSGPNTVTRLIGLKSWHCARRMVLNISPTHVVPHRFLLWGSHVKSYIDMNYVLAEACSKSNIRNTYNKGDMHQRWAHSYDGIPKNIKLEYSHKISSLWHPQNINHIGYNNIIPKCHKTPKMIDQSCAAWHLYDIISALCWK